MPMLPTPTRVGRVTAIYQYPIKSMAGRSLASGSLDTHGLAGDRRFAFRKTEVRTGFPWLTAGRFPQLLRYVPLVSADGKGIEGPTHVRTPAGEELDIWSDALSGEISTAFGSPVELLHLDRGIFDEGAISCITTATVAAVAQAVGRELDIRRFRPNFVVESEDGREFGEDDWVGKTIRFGAEGPHVAFTLRDVRCSMISLDPDTAEVDKNVMKATVRLNENCAGVYGTVLRTGAVSIGDDVYVVAGSDATDDRSSELRGEHA